MLLMLLISFSTVIKASDLQTWITNQQKISRATIEKHISPSDGEKGSVIASPSKYEPDYYYHWVRDAALVMSVLMEEVIEEKLPVIHENFKTITDYIHFSQKIQNQHGLTGLGEPKYYVDGTAFNFPWGRPQNDGPALRSLYLIRLANYLISINENDFIQKELYRSEIPASSLIKKDLEYVAHHWQETSFDLWEEVNAEHFYTLMVQRQALKEGSEFAQKLNDPYAAQFYFHQSLLIEQKINKFIHPTLNYVMASLEFANGLNYKESNLDIAIVLAVLHTGFDGFMSFGDGAIEKTIQMLEESFFKLYPINQRGLPGNLFGRYPEDQFFGGNPWILCSLSVAEYYYKKSMLQHNSKRLADFHKAESMMERIKYHSRPDFSLSEQLDRENGFMKAAENLTWSHASFLTTAKARSSSLNNK